MTNILYIITDLNIGGTEKMLYETVTRLNKNEYKPVVFGLKKWGNYAQKLKDAGIEVKTLNIYRFSKILLPFTLLGAIFTIRKTVKEKNISIITSYLFQSNMLARLAFLSGKKPRIISSIRVMEEQKRWQLFFDRITSGLCEKVIVNSKALKDFLVKNKAYAEDKIEVVYNGIDTKNLPQADKTAKCREIGCNPDNIIIGTIGRIHKQKGIEYLLEAINILNLQSAICNLQFLIVGDGPDKKSLEFRVESLGLKDKVTFTGWRTDTLEIMSILDIFVLPSLWEGTPNVILEAMAYGKPIISTNVGGVPELIENQKDGILISPANPNQLAKKIKWAIKNNEIANKMVKNAKEKVNKLFTIEKMVKEIELI